MKKLWEGVCLGAGLLFAYGIIYSVIVVLKLFFQLEVLKVIAALAGQGGI